MSLFIVLSYMEGNQRSLTTIHVVIYSYLPQERKITTTSFLDASFMKTLASAIRFGTPLLVQVHSSCSY